MKKRLVSLAFILALLLSLFPAAAHAEALAPVQAGDHIYMGEYTEDLGFGNSETSPVCWLVLDADKRNDGQPGLFLLTQYVVQRAGVPFDEALADWKDSLAQQWCADFLANTFTDAERAAIPAVSKHEDELDYALYWRKVDLADEQVFFLSAWEARDYIGPEGSEGLTARAVDGTGAYWWFRTGSFIHPDYTGLVLQGNDIHDSLVYQSWGARPAMNLDPAKILLAVPAAEQPGLGVVGRVSRPDESNWKLILTDESRQLQLRGVQMQGDVLQISYAGATVGEGEYLSLLVQDAEGNTLCRGRLARAEQESGQLTLDLDAEGIPSGSRLFLFSEHESGDYRTNYASPLCPIACTLTLDPGAGSGEPVQIPATPGEQILLPEPSFTAPAGQTFDRWELDSQPLDPAEPQRFAADAVLTALYRDIPVAEILPETAALALRTGQARQLSVTTLPADAAEAALHWSSTSSMVCRVDDSGLVRGLLPGSAVLTVTAEGSSASAQVAVQVSGGAVFPAVLAALALILALILWFLLRRKRR